MFSDSEEKGFLNSFVKSVERFEEEQENGRLLKRIRFRFPVFFNGGEVEELSLDNFSTRKTVALLEKAEG